LGFAVDSKSPIQNVPRSLVISSSGILISVIQFLISKGAFGPGFNFVFIFWGFFDGTFGLVWFGLETGSLNF
jgi:hypothetical protein